MTLPILCARIRVPLTLLGAALLIADGFVALPWWLGPVVLAVGLALYFRVGTVRRAPVALRLPVAGRWSAANSPANRVPSHGMHAYGQSYAIDLVHEPADHSRPTFGWWPVVRRPSCYPAFGQPVLAPCDGVVVRTHARERDHSSRGSWPALIYLLVESALREALGPSRVFGNHVVIRLDSGEYAVLAHLRRHSLRVGTRQRVRAGEQVAECGNSGNSTEPHVHVQLMDRRTMLVSAGLPVSFEGFVVDGVATTGLPRTGQPFVAPAPPPRIDDPLLVRGDSGRDTPG